MLMFFFYRYGDHRYLHFLTHSFPTRRSSDLPSIRQDRRQKQHPSASPLPACPDASTSSNVLTDSFARADGRSILQPGEHPSACRSEEHTSELQSLMRISYAVFCLKKKHTTPTTPPPPTPHPHPHPPPLTPHPPP